LTDVTLSSLQNMANNVNFASQFASSKANKLSVSRGFAHDLLATAWCVI